MAARIAGLASSRMLRRAGAGALLGGGTLTALQRRAPSAAEEEEDTEHIIAQLRRQAEKARKRAQERVRLGEDEVLGMTPKLWLEALDDEHRYGSILYRYWPGHTRWAHSLHCRPATGDSEARRAWRRASSAS